MRRRHAPDRTFRHGDGTEERRHLRVRRPCQAKSVQAFPGPDAPITVRHRRSHLSGQETVAGREGRRWWRRGVLAASPLRLPEVGSVRVTTSCGHASASRPASGRDHKRARLETRVRRGAAAGYPALVIKSVGVLAAPSASSSPAARAYPPGPWRVHSGASTDAASYLHGGTASCRLCEPTSGRIQAPQTREFSQSRAELSATQSNRNAEQRTVFARTGHAAKPSTPVRFRSSPLRLFEGLLRPLERLFDQRCDRRSRARKLRALPAWVCRRRSQ
jgi:hypothetical protein